MEACTEVLFAFEFVITCNIALCAIYPEQQHLFSKHQQVSSGHWRDIKTQRSFFDRLARELNIEKPQDWYSVRLADVKIRGGASFMNYYYRDSLFKGMQSTSSHHLIV
jgi:hypothetical protein